MEFFDNYLNDGENPYIYEFNLEEVFKKKKKI